MYRDLAKLPRSEPIPEDVNAQVVAGLSVFKCTELAALMGEARKLHLFGSLEIADQAGRTWATVEFHKGIATMYYRYTHAESGGGILKPELPYRISLRQSDKNRAVVMKERKPTTEG